MSYYQPAGLLLTGDDLHLVERLVVQVEQDGRKRGAVLSDRFVRLKSQVEAAIAAEATSNGHENRGDGYRLVTTNEYAQMTGKSTRTAQRYAQAHGTRASGRWMIPIKE